MKPLTTENNMDFFKFATILINIAQGEAPVDVCATYGTTFSDVKSYALQHSHMDDFTQALELGANISDGTDVCTANARGECTTCAE